MDGNESNPFLVSTYEVVEKEANTVLPNQEYKSLIVNGAIKGKLPEEYIKKLKSIQTTDQPKRKRKIE